MRVALINPNWSFGGSIYFGCRAPHLPLELKIAQQMLEDAGHTARLIDGHMFDLPDGAIAAELRGFRPDMTVVTTAPTYLFWRCAPPELRVPQQLCDAIRDLSPLMVAVGPHGSTTPRAALRKLAVDVVVMGECEETLVRLANGERESLPSICDRDHNGIVRVLGGPAAARFVDMPPLTWPDAMIASHRHHHHRFEAEPAGRRGRGLARVPLSVHVLRQGKLPQRLSQAAASSRPAGDLGPATAGRRIRLLHRRDLPAERAFVARDGGAWREIRRADTHRSVEAGDARAARPCRLCLGRGRCRKPDAGRP
jgi:hypothetical protein